VYIGREVKKGGWDLPCSKWHNPYRGEQAIEKYEEYLVHSKLMDALEELKGKKLGCWCKPKECHGDVLARYVNERYYYSD
jgi:hypothetical protein